MSTPNISQDGSPSSPSAWVRDLFQLFDNILGSRILQPWECPRAVRPGEELTENELAEEAKYEEQLREEDPDGLDVQLYHLRRVLAKDRGRILAFALALGEYRDMEADFESWRARLRVVDATWETQIQMASTRGVLRTVKGQHQVERQQVFEEAFQSLWHRYGKIWEKTRSDLDVPLVLIVPAVRKAIEGAWRDAVIKLDQAPQTVAEYELPASVVEVFNRLRLPWDMSQQAHSKIEAILQGTRPHPGRRRRGRRDTNYRVHVAIYQTHVSWLQTKPDGSPTAFAQAVLGALEFDGSDWQPTGTIAPGDARWLRSVWPRLYSSQSLDEAAVTKMLTDAEWLRPYERSGVDVPLAHPHQPNSKSN